MEAKRHLYNKDAPRRATNLSLNEDLLKQARRYKINLSRLLERCLIEDLRRRTAAEWVAENAEAIDRYNERVEEVGVFSDGLRRF